mgnify:CR=1 FL=1
MKKLLFLLFVLSTVTTAIYASFPVTNESVIENSTNQTEAPSSEPDWVLAAVCWFFGCLGIHRFMMGDTKNGILMLLTLGGCGIWALIDFIRICMGELSR